MYDANTNTYSSIDITSSAFNITVNNVVIVELGSSVESVPTGGPLQFRQIFGSVVGSPIATVPTLSQKGLRLLALLLVGCCATLLRKRTA